LALLGAAARGLAWAVRSLPVCLADAYVQVCPAQLATPTRPTRAVADVAVSPLVSLSQLVESVDLKVQSHLSHRRPSDSR